MGDKTKKKKSVGEEVKEFLGELWLGRWGRYEEDDEDIDEWENNPRYRKKWSIGISEEDSDPRE